MAEDKIQYLKDYTKGVLSFIEADIERHQRHSADDQLRIDEARKACYEDILKRLEE